MPRRPHSPIRENIKKILMVVGELDGYHLYKVYTSVFRQVTQRSIYYNLKKGVQIGEFLISRIKENKGNFSWGESSRKIFYSLASLPNVTLTPKEKAKIEESYERIKG